MFVRTAVALALVGLANLAVLGPVAAQSQEPITRQGGTLTPPPPKPLRLRIWSLVQTPLPAAKRAPALVLLLPEEAAKPLSTPDQNVAAPNARASDTPARNTPAPQGEQAPAPQGKQTLVNPSFEDSEVPIVPSAANGRPLPQPKPLAVAAMVGLRPKSPALIDAAPSPVATQGPVAAAESAGQQTSAQDLDQVAFASQDGDETYVEVVYVTKQRPLPKDPVQRMARQFVDLIDPSANQIRVKQTRRVAKAPELPTPQARRTDGTSGQRPIVSNPLPASDDKCLRDLARMNVRFKPLDPFKTDKGCGMSDGVELQSIGSVTLKPAAKLNCGYAKRLATWVSGDLSQTVARTTGGQLTAIRHYSAYRCSFRSKGRLSEHASGNALDLAAIETTNAVSLNVEKDWGDHLDWAAMQPMEMAPKSQRPSLAIDAPSDATASAKRQVWYAVTKSACKAFKLVLTPHSNKAHANHLHIDMGRWKQCEL